MKQFAKLQVIKKQNQQIFHFFFRSYSKASGSLGEQEMHIIIFFSNFFSNKMRGKGRKFVN